MLKNKKISEKAYLLTTLLKNEGAREREEAKKARATQLEERFVNTSPSLSLLFLLVLLPLTDSLQIIITSTTTATTTSATK
jgi:hypothetical protein